MDIQSAVQSLQAERPAAIEAIRALIAALPPEARPHCNELLAQMLDMQALIVRKRTDARSLLQERVFLHRDPDMPAKVYAMRHIPDVTVRMICRIADVEHVSSASSEWLDMMEERNAPR